MKENFVKFAKIIIITQTSVISQVQGCQLVNKTHQHTIGTNCTTIIGRIVRIGVLIKIGRYRCKFDSVHRNRENRPSHNNNTSKISLSPSRETLEIHHNNTILN